MSNTRKTKKIKPIDVRIRQMSVRRKNQKLNLKVEQANALQRARHARQKMSELQQRVVSGEISPTEIIHIHDDEGTVEGCPGCFTDVQEVIFVDPDAYIDPDDGYRPETQVITETTSGNH
jgi:hypothetical protein